MATKIIKALIDGVVQEIEVEDIISPEQPLSYDERLDSLEQGEITTDSRLDELEDKPIIADGNFLVGNGTQDPEEVTPDEVLSRINGATVATMTTAEFEALEEHNANTLYMLSDAEETEYVPVDDFASHAENKENPHGVTAVQVGADPTGTATNTVSAHNTSTDAHNDIRLLVEGLTTRLNTLANSDDTTLDQMSEVVAYIKSNRTLIEEVTTNKVNVSDIINNLTTNVTNKPLSAAQGVALKALIDAIVVPTKVSELTNDSGYITSAPVASVNGKTGTVSLTASDVNAMPKVTVSTSDNGKFLRVVNGAWAASSVPNAEEATF